MDKLFEAARRGNVMELHRLLQENPLILHNVALASVDNPLHTACLAGHLNFATQLLILKPDFAKELSLEGYTPMHMASANGYVDLVKELMKSDRELCRLRGADGRTAFHLAALKGKVYDLKEIISACPDSIGDLGPQGETALRLAIRHSQFESLWFMVDWIRRTDKDDLLNARDEQGNTVLHLATWKRQRQRLREGMEMLFEVARRGNVEDLHLLLKENPLLLNYVALESLENPLHLACLCGHLDFAREMLTLKPEFATKLNPKGYSPLHMAAANGYLEIVKELMRFDKELCRLKGRDMKTPLHCATLKGEADVITHMLSVCPECIEDVTIQGETALHLAVKSSQFESLSVMMDWVQKMGKQGILVLYDEQNNTVLSLAMQMEDRRVLQLCSNGNETGTARPSANSTEIPSCNTTIRDSEYFKFQKGRDSPSDVRNTLIVVAVLVATAAFQVGISPPGGVWQDNTSIASGEGDTSVSYQLPVAGTSIWATYDPVGFIIILVLNSIGFSVSLNMIGMLTSRFPLRVELIVCITTLITTYCTALNSVTPIKVRTYAVVFNVVLSTLVPLFIHLARTHLVHLMAPFGRSMMKFKVVRVLAEYYA